MGSAEVIVATAFQFNFSLLNSASLTHTYMYCSSEHPPINLLHTISEPASWGIKPMFKGHLGEDAQEATTLDSGGQQR